MSLASSLKRGSSLDLRDFFFLAGAAAAVYGASLWSVPAAWILGGAVVMYLAIASAPEAQVEEPEAGNPQVPKRIS